MESTSEGKVSALRSLLEAHDLIFSAAHDIREEFEDGKNEELRARFGRTAVALHLDVIDHMVEKYPELKAIYDEWGKGGSSG